MRQKTKSGLRARVARTLADLDPSRRGSRGKRITTRATSELTSAAEEIRKRFLGDSTRSTARSAAGRKAAATRKRNAAKRSAAAKKGARTRAKS
jgi:hypothetical protein